MDDAAFQQRFDIARMVLERKYRWAKYVLRQLQPVQVAKGTMAVDKWMRLYHGPQADTFSDQEFVGALWHEVNHLLRHHPDRLGHLAKKHGKLVNLASDLEINDDLREQGITLPEGVFYSDSPSVNNETHHHVDLTGASAEQHFFHFVEELKNAPKPPTQPSDQDDEEEDDGDDEGDDGGYSPPDYSEPGQPGDNPGDDDDSDEDAEEGDLDGGSPGSNPGDDGDDFDDDLDDSTIPEGDCGSGVDGQDREWEEDEPEDDEQRQVDKAQRKQDEEIADAVESNGGALPPGMGQEVYDAAVERLGRSEHDWRSTVAVEVRNAMEQRADEAEEYTFRRRSRRAAVSDEFILPGSYRPIPQLGVVVDVSGSMDRAKVTASMRELRGIMERLAIPEFNAYAWNTHLSGDVIRVSTEADVEEILRRRGGGTDMQAGMEYAVSQGDEVIIVLTDNETGWGEGPNGIPVIICGINRTDHYPVPEWARLVDVESDAQEGSYDAGY